MNFHHLKTFLSVLNNRNYTRAGEELFLTQSAVSQQIRQLEVPLGTITYERFGFTKNWPPKLNSERLTATTALWTSTRWNMCCCSKTLPLLAVVTGWRVALLNKQSLPSARLPNFMRPGGKAQNLPRCPGYLNQARRILHNHRNGTSASGSRF